MRAETIRDIDSSQDVSLREVEGGWLVKYTSGWDKRAKDDIIVFQQEKIFTDLETMMVWMANHLDYLKRYRNEHSATLRMDTFAGAVNNQSYDSEVYV